MDWYKTIWNRANCSKMPHCAYFTLVNRLPKKRCNKWSKNGEIKCLACKTESEIIEHLFFYCIFSRHIWIFAKRKLISIKISHCTTLEQVSNIFNKDSKSNQKVWQSLHSINNSYLSRLEIEECKITQKKISSYRKS